MANKINAKNANILELRSRCEEQKVTFNHSIIPRPDITDPELKEWFQTRIGKVQLINTVKTDGRKGKELEFNDELKAEILPLVELGLSIEAERNKSHLEAIAAKGHFLSEVDRFLKARKLRIFRTVCSWCGWKKSSAYNWMKLWKAYESNLKDYASYSERQLLICSSHKDPMRFLDQHGAETHEADENELRKMVNPEKALSASRTQRGTAKIAIGHFCYTKRKDKDIISGLDEKHHEDLIALLTSWSPLDLHHQEEVSNALDIPQDSPSDVTSDNVGGKGTNQGDLIDETFLPADSFYASEPQALRVQPS